MSDKGPQPKHCKSDVSYDGTSISNVKYLLSISLQYRTVLTD